MGQVEQGSSKSAAVDRLRNLGGTLLVPGLIVLVVVGIWAGAATEEGGVAPLIAEIFAGLGLVLTLAGFIAIILAGHAEAVRIEPAGNDQGPA